MALGVITTGSIPKLLWEGIRELWGFNYERYEKQYTKLFDVITSKKAWEEYVQVPGLGPAQRKYEGDGVFYDGESQGFIARIVNLSYGLGYIITREAFDDNLYAEASEKMTPELAHSMLFTEETVGANIYNQGFNTSPGVAGADGVSLFSTAHVNFLSPGTTWANAPATSVDLSESSLEDMVILIRSTLDDRLMPIMLTPKSLLVAKAEEFNAQRILKSQYQYNTANNAINVLGQGNYVPDIYVNVYFSSPHAWFIRTNGIPAGKGMIWQDRVPAEITRDNEFDTENYKVKVYARFAPGWADPRACFGSNGP